MRCEKDNATLEKYTVPLLTFNQILEGKTEHIDFISIDIEGYELHALRGLDLKRYEPDLLIIEITSSEAKNEIDAYLNNEGYYCAGNLKPGPNYFYTIRSNLNHAALSILTQNT